MASSLVPRIGRRSSVAVVIGAVAFAVAAIITAPAAHATGGTATADRTWMPPAYLMWRTGGLPSGLTPKLAELPGARRVVVVAGDTLWMRRSIRRDGTIVDQPKAPYRIPIEVMATDVAGMAPFLPLAWRNQVLEVLQRGNGVIGTSSASLRHLRVGDRMIFPGGGRVRIGAIVPDEVVSWSEVLMSRRAARPMGVRHDRFALLVVDGDPTEAQLARRIAPLLGPGYRPRVRRPGHAQFRRQGDSVWPPVLMKRGFGEFSAYPDPRRPGYLRMHPSFVRRHLVSKRVRLLGRFTCHRALFPALIEAMSWLRSRGHARAVRNFAGCYNARMVMRIPSGAISHHSWGAAVDINSISNPYGARPNQPRALVRAMTSNGFTWGGRWTVPDAMHFEYVAVRH